MSEVGGTNLSAGGVAIAETIPLRGPVRMLADHMARSHAQYAAFTNMGEVDATGFEAFRARLAAQIDREYGERVSFTHFIIKILAQCLEAHPAINSTLDEDQILILAEINIGFAVALASGMLIVPVVRHADEKSVVQIAEECSALAERARSGRLTLEDVTGGTFTLTNAGMFRHKSATSTGGWSTPIITIPQSAILGLGALYQKPVVRNGEIAIRTMLPTSFTIDHRVINGVPAIEFMNAFYEHIENPEMIELGI
jgi:pyruvate dehydrogenase E2 component (dihydrolipoamide acetyltransferase)